MPNSKPYRIIISAGGTGGHIYPAVAVANMLKEMLPNVEFLFVGALGRMEMEKVPKAGYEIVGLPIAGIQRRFTLENLKFPFKLWKSLRMARKLVKDFEPDVAVGFGGYASGPMLKASAKQGVITVLQEQNSYAGITNKWLAKSASKICVAYENMEKFFPADKIVFTGNPVRKDLNEVASKRGAALEHFKLDSAKPVVLVIGGSLGARTINESMAASLDKFAKADVQLLWQTGKLYGEKGRTIASDYSEKGIYAHEFIYEMDLAYAAADVVISRAGALSISELCLVEKPVVLVPSPNVAEDHQTMNAMALVNRGAAKLVSDVEAREKLTDTTLALVADKAEQEKLSIEIKKLAKPKAAAEISQQIIDLIQK